MSATARPGPLNRAIRRFNRNVYNPLAMTVAGLRHSPYSAVKHFGRKSGRPYETPVIAHAVGDASSSRCRTATTSTGAETSSPSAGARSPAAASSTG